MINDVVRFLEEGYTRLSTKDDQDYLDRLKILVDDAVEAEEVFGIDELERFCERQRRES